MAFLRNSNGENYKIIGSRPSKEKGHKDYIVQSKGGGVTVAHCWLPKHKCWVQGDFYGWGDDALKRAKKDFNNNK